MDRTEAQFHSNAIPLASTDTRARAGTQVGLLLLVVEAGLEVDLGTLKQIGVRGLTVAVLGSFGPLGVGTLLTHYGLGLDLMSSLAVGCSLAPTSMAIGLAVLKANGRLRTPSGQLIIAAAVIDDVIALILLLFSFKVELDSLLIILDELCRLKHLPCVVFRDESH